MRKLAMLNRAGRLDDMRVPPGNRLEGLRGDRAGQHSIRINDQFRICFVWTSQYRLAKEIGVPQRRIGEIVAGNRAVTADTSLRLSRFFNVSEGFWIGLQTDYDAAIAKDSLAKTLAKIKPWSRGPMRKPA